MASITLTDIIKNVNFNTSSCEKVMYNGVKVWDKSVDLTKCLLFTSSTDAQLTIRSNYSQAEYSTDGINWTNVPEGINFNLPDIKVYLRNNSPKVPIINISGGPIDISGNITTMVDYTKEYKEVDIPAGMFDSWLYSRNVRSVPTIICRDVGERALVSFAKGASSIEVAPIIDVVSTNTYSMTSAFSGCSGISTAVHVNVGNINGKESMSYMFTGTGITEATVTYSSANTATNILQGMFSSCKSLKKAMIYGNPHRDDDNAYYVLFSSSSELEEVYITADALNFGTSWLELGSSGRTIHCKSSVTDTSSVPWGWTVIKDL